MAPSATQTQTVTQTQKSLRIPIMVEAASRSIDHWIPLRLSGASKTMDQHDLTPVIGTQFENIDLAEILHSSLCDEKIRDIAITSKYQHCNPTQDIFPSIRCSTIRLHTQVPCSSYHK